MSVVKKILLGTLLGSILLLFLAQAEHPAATPRAPERFEATTPTRADLAEAVYAMVLENAQHQGLGLDQPPTLCQACVAAHLGLPAATAWERCRRACGLP